MTDGRTNFAEAFNIADKHVDETNFLSIWCCIAGGQLVPTDSKLDDNWDWIGHDRPLPSKVNGDGYLAEKTGL